MKSRGKRYKKQVFENRLIFEYFHQAHKHLGKLLDVNYGWAVEQPKTRMDMPYLNSLKRLQLYPAPLDSNRPP